MQPATLRNFFNNFVLGDAFVPNLSRIWRLNWLAVGAVLGWAFVMGLRAMNLSP